jgi:hypothetical protein
VREALAEAIAVLVSCLNRLAAVAVAIAAAAARRALKACQLAVCRASHD